MFGESDSESPRVGSPWDSFIPAPSLASPAELEMKARLNEGLPKLVPEVEYGNVEYKLKLVSPSPERFLRLVTQMKWRLLEGGGQAYYELGVADSGHLVGLSRKDLEQSLETLEMMAGEIGASVVVVKEIEVPAALVGRGMGEALGIPQRTPVPVLTVGDHETNMVTETETSTTEDDDDFLLAGLELGFETPPNATRPITYYQAQSTNTRSHPERPAFQSSPAILPTPDLDVDTLFHSDFEIEIASVYKPRPHRSRPAATAQTKFTKRGTIQKSRKPLHPRVEMDPIERAKEKRLKRDTRREARHKALLTPDTGSLKACNDGHARNAALELNDLHAGLETLLVKPQPIVLVLPDLGEHEGNDIDESAVNIATHGPRLIVEALVVRKLALEEAFLDFGGFALEI